MIRLKELRQEKDLTLLELREELKDKQGITFSTSQLCISALKLTSHTLQTLAKAAIMAVTTGVNSNLVSSELYGYLAETRTI